MAKEKIDKISEDITDIKISIAEINQTLLSQHESLEKHISRSEAIEAQVEILKEHVYKAHGVKEFIIFTAKILAGLSGLIALITLFMKIHSS